MIDYFKNRFSFINSNSFIFSSLQHSSNSNNLKLTKNYFKKEILNTYNGDIFFYGGARMGIFLIMKYLNLKKNDEVLVTAFTCSVVVNSIKKFGSKPVYVDIDPFTLGTCPIDTKRKITSKTKLIIAQHSFGIPCEINKIKTFAKKKKIFLLEDCSISVCSSINKKYIGTFGDASIFSFDHTKPINCFVGGALYVKNKKIISFLQNEDIKIKEIPNKKIKKMTQRFNLENSYCNFSNYKKFLFFDKIFNLINKFDVSPYLDEDLDPFGKKNISYPYPSKIPNFALNCLIKSIKNLKFKQHHNSLKLNKIIKFFNKKKFKGVEHYKKNKNKDIKPFRFVWLDINNKINYKNLSKYININEIWYKQPIINLTENISLYNYKNNCINSQKSCEKIINLPNSIPINKINLILKDIYE